MIRESISTATARRLASTLGVLSAAAAVVALGLLSARLTSLENSARAGLQTSVNRIVTVSSLDGTPILTTLDVDAAGEAPGAAWATGLKSLGDAVVLDSRIRFVEIYSNQPDAFAPGAPQPPFALMVASSSSPFSSEAELRQLEVQNGAEPRAVYPIDIQAMSNEFDPVLAGSLVAKCTSECGAYTQVRILAETPGDVARVTSYLELQFASDSDRVGITTSEEFARLSQRLSDALTADAQDLAILILVMVGAVFALVGVVGTVQRRREIGRRRILGGTRSQIMALLLWEGILVGAVGALFGLAAVLVVQSIYFPDADAGGAGMAAIQVWFIASISGLPVAGTALATDPVSAVRMP